MNKLLGSIKNLQLVVHMTLMQIVMPANSQVLMSAIFEKVTYEAFDTSLFTLTFYAPTEPDYDDKLAQLGYESAFCLINMGSCLYIIFGQLLIVLLQSVLLACLQLMCFQGANAAKIWL